MQKAVTDRVIVKQLLKEKSTSGIILSGEEKTNRGIVEAVGPLVASVQVGDTVILPSTGFEPFTDEDQDYLVMPEENILSIK